MSLVVCWHEPYSSTCWRCSRPIPLSLMALDETRQVKRRIYQELRLGVPCGPCDTRAAHSVPRRLGRPGGGKPWNRHADRRDGQRAHLRAAVPGHVRPAGALAREERLVGKGRHERLQRNRADRKEVSRDGMTCAGRPRRQKRPRNARGPSTPGLGAKIQETCKGRQQ